MKSTVTLPLQDLQAVALFAAAKDIRYYLNGVLIEVKASRVRIVATNGHILGMVETMENDDGRETPPADAAIIVPIETVAMLKKGTTAMLTYGEDGYSIEVIGGACVKFTPIDGTFPDYARVVPRTCSGEAAQFSSEYLALIHKLRRIYGVSFGPSLHQNGQSSALFGLHSQPQFIGVLMPMRDNPPPLPEWLDRTWPPMPAPEPMPEPAPLAIAA